MKSVCLALPVLLLLFSPTVSLGEDGPEDHLGGFFLRLSTGGGYANTSLESGGTKLTMSGAAGDVNFAIGGIVSPNLALHGTLFGWSVIDPKVKLESGSSSASGTANGDLTLSGIGAGLTYYFMPVNIYVSGTIGFGRMSVEGAGTKGESDIGPMFDATLGKEWWVGQSWALGVALGLGFHSVPEKGISDRWTGPSVAVRFTATMN